MYGIESDKSVIQVNAWICGNKFKNGRKSIYTN